MDNAKIAAPASADNPSTAGAKDPNLPALPEGARAGDLDPDAIIYTDDQVISFGLAAQVRGQSRAGAEPYAYEEDDGADMKLVYAEWFEHGMGKMDPECIYRPLYLAAPMAQSTAGAAKDDEQAAFETYFCMTLSCDGSESEALVEACRAAALDAWMERARRAAPAPHAQPEPAAQPDLHNAIMNLPAKPGRAIQMNGAAFQAYKEGHRDARHAAAELVSAAESTAAQVPTAAESRDQAMEEAAQACLTIGSDWLDAGDHHKEYAADYLAKAIRALPTTSKAQASAHSESGGEGA